MNENQKPTTKTRIYNLIILDKSGSMSSIRQAAFTGCNEVLGGIKAAAEKHADTQEHFVSLMLFDTESMPYILDMVPAAQIQLMKEEQFIPCACTPLLDAIGMALTRLEAEVKKHERALASVTIITDGYENASKEYDGNAIKALVDELKANGWVFAYIGANQDVEKVAASMSITNTMCFDTTPEGTIAMWQKLSKARGRLYACMAFKDFCAEFANEDFFDKED